MLAYANPPDITDERQRADGYGLVRFNKNSRRITFECWPRFADAKRGDAAQFPGWPITIAAEGNDGRKPVAWLPEIDFQDTTEPVVQVIDEQSGEMHYTIRIAGSRFQPPVFAPGHYTIKVGRDRPDGPSLQGLPATEKAIAGKRTMRI
jgi:hypothetical protein